MHQQRKGGRGRFGPLDDAPLIRRAREGDPEAMDRLVHLHHRAVFNLAYRLAGNYDDAEDIVSEAFLRVFNALPSFRGDANFSTWLYRIVYNVFLDERKKQRVRAHGSLEEIVELEDSTVTRQVEDPDPGPAERVADLDRAERIQRAVARLPERQRTLITLYHFQDCSYEEIAEILQMPIGTVKSGLNRARHALRLLLAGERELLEA